MSSSFADLGVPADAVRALRARGIDSAFPIQSLAIPPALAGRDICGRAPTGSGKTIAFGLAVATKVGRARPGHPEALILAPTRELAGQIEAEMSLLMGPERRRRVAAFYGGVGFGAQLNALRRGVDVIVACPGRLKDLMARGAVSLSNTSIVVIDEADRMADMGFLPDVKHILDQVRPDRQTMLFSATLDKDVDALVRRYQHDPVRVAVESDEQRSTTPHHWIETRQEDRIGQAASLAASHGTTIVFCRTKHGTDRVAKQLGAAGVKAVALHGGRSQSQRERALLAFSSGRAQVLVATDVAARGIHVDDVGCVVHFDLPGSGKDYLHRSGRTGRAGSDGVVFCFVNPSDLASARSLRKEIGHQIELQWATEGASRVRPSGAASTAPRASHQPSRPRPARPSDRRQGATATSERRQPAGPRAARKGRPPRRRNRAA